MRYLIIAENPGFSVSHREELLRRLRAVLLVIAVRIATGHVEVDVKTDDLEKAVAEVEKVVGKVLEVVDITFEDVGGGVRDTSTCLIERGFGKLTTPWKVSGGRLKTPLCKVS